MSIAVPYRNVIPAILYELIRHDVDENDRRISLGSRMKDRSRTNFTVAPIGLNGYVLQVWSGSLPISTYKHS